MGIWGMKNDNDIQNRMRTLAGQVAEDEGLELIEAVVLGPGRKKIVRVTVDKESGVNVGDCERVSRGLEALLDVEDLFMGAYLLEVSSPGLDRPLAKMSDFVRSTGKLAKVVTSENIGNGNVFVGRIIDTGEDWIRLRPEEKPEKGRPKKKAAAEPADVFIPLDKISKARLEIE
jgi:ribosome maturation factor RimP